MREAATLEEDVPVSATQVRDKSPSRALPGILMHKVKWLTALSFRVGSSTPIDDWNIRARNSYHTLSHCCLPENVLSNSYTLSHCIFTII